VPIDPKARPREAKGLIAPVLRVTLAPPYRAVLRGLLAIGAQPDHITIASLTLHAFVGAMILRGWRLVPGLVYVFAGALDVFDGAIARERGTVSVRGGWLDSVLDRVGDALVLGALFFSLVAQGHRLEAGFALIGLLLALLVSHIRAEAEAEGAKLGEGLFARAERFIVVLVGLLLPHVLLPALAVLCALGSVAIVQRLFDARKISLRSTQ